MSDYRAPDKDRNTRIQLQERQDNFANRKKKRVLGTVKWFNVKNEYSFINCEVTREDIHQIAIAQNNPHKIKRSVGVGETVEFDVVVVKNGRKAANVTGPDEKSV